MLNKHNFEIASLASDDPDRLTLCGIYVTPEGTMETDGHQAIIVSSVESTQGDLFADLDGVEPADFFTPFILDRESALKVAKAIPKKAEDAARYGIVDATTEDNELAMVSVNDRYRQEILKAKKISGKFPDVEKVFPPAARARHELRMSPSLLAEVVVAVERFCKGHALNSIKLTFFESGDPVVIEADSLSQKLRAAVMPQRGEAKDGAEAGNDGN